MGASKRKTDIVYFLGAGFSAPFEIPTMKQMVMGFEKDIGEVHLSELYKNKSDATLYLKRFPPDDPLGRDFEDNLRKIEREIDKVKMKYLIKYSLREIQQTWLNLFREGDKGKEEFDVETLILHSTLKCNTKVSDFEGCFEAQALPGSVIKP